MNREEIVKLAKECTAPEWWDEGMDRFHMGMDFVAFAASIRAATKEEDARICEAEIESWERETNSCFDEKTALRLAAKAIRASK